jgi:DNA-binding NarL/FixJ family response regulator
MCAESLAAAESSKVKGARVRIALVDDHHLFRLGLVALLEGEADLEIVGHASGFAEALALEALTTADVAVVDVLLATSDGVELTRELRARGPSPRILGLSVLDNPTRIAEMLRAGADGFALKSQPAHEILAALRTVIAGERYIAPSIQPDVEPLMRSKAKLPLELLTTREREIFELLIRGHSNDGIGGRLSIAPRTVDTHRQRIMRKLKAHSVADLVRLAARRQGVLV